MKFLRKRPWIITLSIAGIILLGFFAFGAEAARAQDWNSWRTYIPGEMQREGGISQYVQDIINAALLLAAVVAVAYLIIGGYKYVTSSGNAEAVEAAKTTILNAIIGLVIIFAAFIIVDFIYKIITDSTGSGNNTILTPKSGGGTPGGGTGTGGTGGNNDSQDTITHPR